MPRSKENVHGYTDEEQKLSDETVRNGDDMTRMRRMRDDRRRREDEEDLKAEWPGTEAAREFKKLGEAFTACQKLMQSPKIERSAKLADGERVDVFTMLRDNLQKANRAPRCDYQKTSGEFCRAPKMRGQKYCCMHLAMEAARPKKFSLPALDDANAIQVAITKGAQGLVDGTLEEKCATRLGYYLQLAMSNVGRVDFEPEEEEEDLAEAN